MKQRGLLEIQQKFLPMSGQNIDMEFLMNMDLQVIKIKLEVQIEGISLLRYKYNCFQFSFSKIILLFRWPCLSKLLQDIWRHCSHWIIQCTHCRKLGSYRPTRWEVWARCNEILTILYFYLFLNCKNYSSIAEQHLDGGHPCFFKANLDYANENATCSLGYMSFLDNAKEICSTDDIWLVNGKFISILLANLIVSGITSSPWPLQNTMFFAKGNLFMR